MKIMTSESVEMFLELDREVDGTLVLDLVTGYRADVPGRLVAMETLIANRNGAKIAFEAHAIKSTFANFGAVPISNILEQIEVLAKSQDWSAVQTAFARIKPLASDFDHDMNDLEARAINIRDARKSAS